MNIKLKFVLLVCLLGILTACARNLPTSTPVVTPNGTFVNSPLQWDVEFLQNERVLPTLNGEIEIYEAPFTIRVKLPTPLTLQLNVFDKDSNFQQIKPGFMLEVPCTIEALFCAGTGYAEEKQDTTLFIGAVGSHYWYYESENNTRWSRVSINAEQAIFERDVVSLNKQHSASESSRKLYLLFFVNYREKQVVNEDEIKKFTLVLK